MREGTAWARLCSHPRPHPSHATCAQMPDKGRRSGGVSSKGVRSTQGTHPQRSLRRSGRADNSSLQLLPPLLQSVSCFPHSNSSTLTEVLEGRSVIASI